MGYAIGDNEYNGNSNDAVLSSIDLYIEDDSGDISYYGSITSGSPTITTTSPSPNCTQVAGQYELQSPLAEMDAPLTTQSYITGEGEDVFFSWQHTFFDDGDRSFIGDFSDYPWVSLGAFAIVGIDADNGDTFEGFGNAEIFIDYEIDGQY